MKTIRYGNEYWKLHDNGQIERPERAIPPSDNWRVIGAVRRNNFGSIVETFTLAELLETAIQWQYANGKQRVFIQDYDHGAVREWRSPNHCIVETAIKPAPKRKRRPRKLSDNIGSVSSGTMRPEDLIPDFLWMLKQQSPLKREHRALVREIEQRMQAPDYYESENASFDLNEGLFDALNEYAPPYFYFGSHPGDGADYGFWLSEDFEHEFDGLKVSDLCEVPKGYTGEVLLINDHGNMSLYAYSRGRGRELWAIV